MSLTGGVANIGGRAHGGAATSGGAPPAGGAATGGTAAGAAATGGAPNECRFSFFVTSLAAMQRLSGSQNGFGGDLRYGEANGLAGADKICATIAMNIMPCAGAKTWRAFLSDSTVDAIDRIGPGPAFASMSLGASSFWPGSRRLVSSLSRSIARESGPRRTQEIESRPAARVNGSVLIMSERNAGSSGMLKLLFAAAIATVAASCGPSDDVSENPGQGEAGGTLGSAGGATGGGGSAAGASGGSGGAGTTTALCLDFGTPTQVGTIANSSLAGPSGIAASRAYPGVLYAHLDAGGTATIYVMTLQGTHLGEYLLGGVTATDWEDMAAGPGPGGSAYLYLGDIGDNAARQGSGTVRTEIQVYRVAEPEVSTSQAAAQRTLTDWQVLRFTYPDHAHDAETLMVDPVTGDLVIVTKESDGTAVVFRAPANTPTNTPTVLEQVAVLQMGAAGQGSQVSAGDVSPSGDRLMVRTYSTVLIWPRGASLAATFEAEPHAQSFTTEPQGEGITFSADGTAWIAAGEQARAIYQATADCS